MLRNEYLKQVQILGTKAEIFERAGDNAKADEVNLAIQDLDFKTNPDLVDMPYFEVSR